MMKRDRRLDLRPIGLALCALLLAAVLPQPAAAEQTLQTVRVGFFAFDGYHMMDADGTRSGYGYDILQHMAGYTDWEYSYVGYDKGWSEMQDMLASGQIDLLTSAQKTEEREQRFDFSDEALGVSTAILTVRAGDDRYALRAYDAWSGIRIGLLRNNSRNDGLAAFAAEQGFAYEPVYFDDTDALVAALAAGDGVDAVVTSNLRSITDEWVLAQFDPSPFYAMVRKGDDALLAEVNAAIAQMNVDEPDLRTELMELYYTPDSGSEIAFTPEERAYIAASGDKALTAVINPDREPFSRYVDGQADGIIRGIADEIIARCGLTVRFLETKDRSEYKKLIESGVADLRFDAPYDYNESEKLGYRLTVPYLDLSVSKLYRRDQTSFDSVALLAYGDLSGRYQKQLEQRYGTLAYYATMAELVEAVSSGRQDVAYLYTRSAEQAAREDVTNMLETEALYGYTTSFAVAVHAGQDPLLFSILKKTVASIGRDGIEDIVQAYASEQAPPFSLIGYMYDYPVHIIIGLILLFIVIALGMAVWFSAKRRRREYEQLVEAKRRGELLSDALATAEHAGESKSLFLSRVSHEMRTPLNAIIGFLTLAKDAEPEEISSYLANSELAARQLLSVINDVLDMSAIESGKMKVSSAPFDFRHMIHQLTGMFVAQCSQKGVVFETRILTPMDEWLLGDQFRVNQILMNLLSNAVKFTDEGHVHLSISQLDAREDRVFVRFAVSDTGCGMSEEMQARLFRPFEQESSQTAQKYGGSGLGLSIVKNLVGMLDGAVRVESRQGEGSTFTVDLPFGRTQAAGNWQLPGNVEDIRVLAVDDEATERAYISAVLTRMRVRHACVEGADAALAELARATEENDPFNICLIDWRMPHANGIETTRRIRERYGRNVVVIVVSAYEHGQVGKSAIDAGANLFLSKPLFQSSLLDLFMTLTGGRMAKKETGEDKRDFVGRRVLLAEDNAMNRLVTVGLIKKFGIACEVAEDGKIAVDKFLESEHGYYDAILMDIQMPNLDGFEATRRIRSSAHPDAQAVPIIALTANAFVEDIAKALSGGMNDHVAKPIELPALLAAFDKAFGEPVEDKG